MLFSLAIIFLCGMLLGALCRRVHLPALLGMLVCGILLGPYAFNLISADILQISAALRQIALVIILMRAGLSLDLQDLRRAGRPAVLLCFVPACCEIAGMVWLAPQLLGVTWQEAAVMGAVVAAVSPAVIVPKMLTLMEGGWGTAKQIPQMLLAGASVDDVFVIVLFTVFCNLAGGQSVRAVSALQIPVSILLGAAGGALAGVCLAALFCRVHMRDSAKVLVLVSVAFLLVTLESAAKGIVPFSGLLAVMTMGIAIKAKRGPVAKRLSAKFSKLWVAAEILLFVLVGATVDIRYALASGGKAVVLILLVLLLRMGGVLLCMIKTKLNFKERCFCMLAYMPKATVQAAIGAVPLAMGLACGQTVLTVAVLAILITAPLGALCIDATYKRWLTQDTETE